ncbi:unnamed protein product [Cuscuta europaea]|uniref:Uncharacterized protein n=1 Tax=Cuscuta europaea TaxID=41803 RepID=A0A9P0Z564_CUSEU|nr:unnamed protein product [Cuscuta europaea]
MNLLSHLWDDTVAGPPPDDGLGKLRKFSTFSSRTDSGKAAESEAQNPNQRSLTLDTSDDGMRVTKSIMILKSPRNQSKDSPPQSPSPSPAGSTPPVSPFFGKLVQAGERRIVSRRDRHHLRTRTPEVLDPEVLLLLTTCEI